MDPLPTDTTLDVRGRPVTAAVLPVGSFEQHGPHLPLTTDTLVACAVAGGVARAYPVRLLPPVTISCSHEHAAWPGTVSISAATLTAVVTDVAASLRAAGVPALVLVNGHGGNHVLRNVVQEASVGPLPMALFPGGEDWVAARAAAGIVTSHAADMHAGELETSILLHTHPDQVRPGFAGADHDADERPHLLSRGLQAYTDSGVVGRPSLATAGKGRAVLDALVAAFAGHLRALAPG
ncbi:creatininase family protein [Pseudonocardia sp. C8]|uniref:creatininase family protein n=1 Tax=Pseudonocardia sp. C8 TaxID=2762759 RepID=UPI0021075E4B|nr:creatininase family protein [Pseudonocardia sp. C8]